MARKKGFEIDRRVNIAMDALSPSQKASIGQVLHDKDGFIEYASVPGRIQKLSSTQPIYKMRVGSSGLRLIYSKVGEDIAVLDVMHKATMDGFASKKKRKGGSPKKSPGHTSAK